MFTSLHSTVRVVARSSCPDSGQWLEEGGSCYAFNSREAVWDARERCRALSSSRFRVELPIVTSAEEDAALMSKFPGGRRPLSKSLGGRRPLSKSPGGRHPVEKVLRSQPLCLVSLQEDVALLGSVKGECCPAGKFQGRHCPY